ncbi:MAG: hypothetical protein ACMUIA_01920 [bacterium]
MFSYAIDILTYPIIIVNPDPKPLPWQAELGKNFLFYHTPGFQECSQTLADLKNVAAIVCHQGEEKSECWEKLRADFPQVEMYVLLSLNRFNHFKSSISPKPWYHPLLSSSPPEILRLEFAQAIERYALRQERDFWLAAQKRENRFSLIGQLTRDWAHEIKNYVAIISLNAEISMARVRKLALTKSISLESMEKIIEQCLKISGVLDGIREFLKGEQPELPLLSLAEIIEHTLFILKSENYSSRIKLEQEALPEISFPQMEGTWLQSALVNILRYYNQITGCQGPLSLSIEKEHDGPYLKIYLKNILPQAIPFYTDFIDMSHPLSKSIHIEPKKRDFFIGVRLLKSLGGEIAIEKDGDEKMATLRITLLSYSANMTHPNTQMGSNPSLTHEL